MAMTSLLSVTMLRVLSLSREQAYAMLYSNDAYDAQVIAVCIVEVIANIPTSASSGSVFNLSSSGLAHFTPHLGNGSYFTAMGIFSKTIPEIQ
jgi:hypothetical protein